MTVTNVRPGTIEYKTWDKFFSLFNKNFQNEFKKRANANKETGLIKWDFFTYGQSTAPPGYEKALTRFTLVLNIDKQIAKTTHSELESLSEMIKGVIAKRKKENDPPDPNHTRILGLWYEIQQVMQKLL